VRTWPRKRATIATICNYVVGRNLLSAATLADQRAVLGMYFARTTADQTISGLTPVNVLGLSFPVLAGVSYRFRFMFAGSAASNSNGARVGMTGPTFSTFSAIVSGVVQLGGTGALYTGYLASYADVVAINGLPLKNADAPTMVDGIILPSINGTLQLQVGAGVLSAPLTVSSGAVGELIRIG
jgi:hypothetical protein